MLRAAIGFFIIGLMAMLFGASGIAGVSIELGRMLLGIFVVLGLASLLISLFTGKRPSVP